MLIFFEAVRQTFALLGGERRARWVAVVILAIAVAGFEAIGALLIAALISVVSGEASGVTLPIVGDVRRWVPGMPVETFQAWLTVVVVVFFLVRAVVQVGQLYIQARIVHTEGARLAAHLVRGYLAMPYVAHTQMNSAELIRNAFDSVQSLMRQVMRPAVELVTQSVLVVALLVVLMVVAPLATLIALAALLPIIWILQAVVQPRLKRLGRRAQESRRDALKAMQQALGGLRDIRLLAREDEFADRFRRQRRVMARSDYLHESLTGLPKTTMETGLVLVIVALSAVAASIDEGREGAIATLGVFAYAGLRLQPSLRQIVQGLNHIRFGSAVVEDLLADRRRVDAVLDARRSRRPEVRDGFARSIELRGVTFAYVPGGPPALRDVDLAIEKGEFVGICGPTGGGKSTLVDLIVGLLEPSEGEVLVDGRRLEAFPTWWYAELGVVSQSVYLLDDTVRRNIAFGIPDAEIDEARVRRAVERAQLADVVAGLPDGLDTFVGERGVRLSGGQRQRVAVARALYREPSVIVFDEGTAALDSATEAALVAAINELRAGRTLISVAHRISTVSGADRIVLVEGGRIAAEGRHDELLGRNDLFRTLAQ